MIENETVQSALPDPVAGVIGYLPTVVAAIIILVLGWSLARLIAALARRLAYRIGLDDFVARTDLAKGLQQAGITRSASDLVGLLVYWLVLLSFVLMFLENLGFAEAVLPLQGVIAYLPRLLAALLILIAGAVLAQFAGKATQATTASMGVEFHKGLGKAVHGGLLVITVIVVIDQ